MPAADVGLSIGPIPLVTERPETKSGDLDERQRARETSDVMWRLNKYNEINCQCGAKLRIPSKFKESTVTCPHCGRIHQVLEET